MQTLTPIPPGIPQYQGGFHSPGGVTIAYEEDYSKQHVIEGDGLCPLIYQHLFKNTKGREHSLSTVRLPETVVFDHNFPRAWYFYDEENKSIGKRSSKMLDAQTMYNYFSKSSAVGVNVAGTRRGKGGGESSAVGAPPRECDIVAQFFHTTVSVSEEWKDVLTRREKTSGRYEGQLLTYVEFLTAETLHDFLFRQSRKPDGVLQKFVIPKGEGTSRRNAQLQVNWSPLMTTVYKRTNKHRLDDNSVTLCARAATYDGPRWYSEETMAADETKVRLKSLCEDISAHFYSTEGKHLTRLGLYFKTDDRSHLWLLWCSCVRVAADSLNPSFLRVPPALDMRAEVLNEGNSTVMRIESRRLRQKQLLALDNELYGVTKDLGFALTVNASHKRQAAALDMRGMAAAEESGGGGNAGPGRRSCSSPAYDPQHPLYPSFQRIWTPQDVANAQLVRPGSGGGGGGSGSSSGMDVFGLHSHTKVGGGKGTPAASPHGRTQQLPSVRELVEEELVGLAMDAWYAVYSTTLAEDPGVMPTRVITLAAPLVGVLTGEELDVLVDHVLRLTKVPEAAADSQYMVIPYLVSSGRRLDRPSAQVEKEVQGFFTDLFARRGEEVVQACLDNYAPYFTEC